MLAGMEAAAFFIVGLDPHAFYFFELINPSPYSRHLRSPCAHSKVVCRAMAILFVSSTLVDFGWCPADGFQLALTCEGLPTRRGRLKDNQPQHRDQRAACVAASVR